MKIILNILFVILSILTTGYFVYIHATNPITREQLLVELNPLLPEVIARFDRANLDDPVTCKEELEQIGYILTFDVADAIDFMQLIPYQTMWSESARELDAVERQANKIAFSFSFAALNSCVEPTYFKLDKDKLRQSLVKLEASIKSLNE